MHVRLFRPADAPALARIFYGAIHDIASLYYSDDQVRAWAPEVPNNKRIEDWASNGRVLLVTVDEDDEPLAFADLEMDGHIDHLFCRPDAAGKGVASVLYDSLEAAAREAGLKSLYVEASEPAQRFFARKGFCVDHRSDFFVRGVPIHNYRMEKSL